MPDAPQTLTLLDQFALGILAQLRDALPHDPDDADAKQMLATAYRMAGLALRERRAHDHGAMDPWSSWRDVAARFLLACGWTQGAKGWMPSWGDGGYYDNLGDAVDAQADRDDRMSACVACARLAEHRRAAHDKPIPFHTCGVVTNLAPAPGPCPKASDADKGKDVEHRMQIRFAGEMQVVDCAACGALSPDSD